MLLSGAIGGMGGCFFAQYFLYIDPLIAFGVDKSIEMLLVSMIGGAGTVYGPLVGAVLLALVSDVHAHADADPGPVAGAVWRLAGGHHRVPAQRPDRPVQPRAAQGEDDMMLQVTGLTKIFGGLRAVDDASLQVEQGRIVALIGPNGAGKTTLFACIAGFQPVNAGSVRFMGQDITGWPVHRIARAGMVRTFQITQPFARLTVHENIAVGAYQQIPRPRRRPGNMRGRSRASSAWRPMLEQPAADLTVAGRKRLELARALATRPQAAAARRGHGRAQSVRDPGDHRHHPRDPRQRRHGVADRTRHACGDEPVGPHLRVVVRQDHRAGQRRRRWCPTRP